MDGIRAISFDCYGTLIDWQTGILRAARPALARHGIKMADAEIVRKFAAAERRAEGGAYVTYKGVLRRVKKRARQGRAMMGLCSTLRRGGCRSVVRTCWRGCGGLRRGVFQRVDVPAAIRL